MRRTTLAERPPLGGLWWQFRMIGREVYANAFGVSSCDKDFGLRTARRFPCLDLVLELARVTNKKNKKKSHQRLASCTNARQVHRSENVAGCMACSMNLSKRTTSIGAFDLALKVDHGTKKKKKRSSAPCQLHKRSASTSKRERGGLYGMI